MKFARVKVKQVDLLLYRSVSNFICLFLSFLYVFLRQSCCPSDFGNNRFHKFVFLLSIQLRSNLFLQFTLWWLETSEFEKRNFTVTSCFPDKFMPQIKFFEKLYFHCHHFIGTRNQIKHDTRSMVNFVHLLHYNGFAASDFCIHGRHYGFSLA